MIEHKIGDFLIKKYTSEECCRENKETNTKVAVIIETRDAYFLPFVIKNFCHYLGEDWNFHLFVNEKVDKFLKEQLPNFKYKISYISNSRMTPQEYSGILRQKNFWKQIKEETILIFQTDTILLRPIEKWAEEFDMIGAPCGYIKGDKCIFNGGLSIRKKTAMIDVGLEMHENIREGRPEDVFFTEELWEKGGYKLPSAQTAFQFASEDTKHNHCIGIHGTNKYYG